MSKGPLNIGYRTRVYASRLVGNKITRVQSMYDDRWYKHRYYIWYNPYSNPISGLISVYIWIDKV